MSLRAFPCALAAVGLLALAAFAHAKASHAGWPHINGILYVNRPDLSRTRRGLPDRHNELLGGHGNDTLYAGNVGDVLWGDYKPSGQPDSQVDHLYGGTGRDFIYTSHGTNFVYTGAGRDVVHAHFGRGEIHCGSGRARVYLSHRSRRRYHLFGCRHISY
ncbi:MAG TPA: hypothetical protein VGN69_02355 [Solirubrobacteraceae bacterium]|nr:hypothetical protein [Solirubrobacteraceae bacterium]